LQRVEKTVNQNWSGHILSWEVDVIQIGPQRARRILG
jgi:hypothetical protein